RFHQGGGLCEPGTWIGLPDPISNSLRQVGEESAGLVVGLLDGSRPETGSHAGLAKPEAEILPLEVANRATAQFLPVVKVIRNRRATLDPHSSIVSRIEE